MPDDDARPALSAPSWRVPNLLAALVALALLATTVYFLVRGNDAADTGSSALAREQVAVARAAAAEATAFLSIDHRDMDRRIQAVLDGATGTFKEEYAAGERRLRTSTQRSEAVSRARVLRVGISTLDASRAVVLVAADAAVTNTSTGGKAQPRVYRLRLTLERQGGRWLTSELGYVG